MHIHSNSQGKSKRLIWSILLNILITATQAVAGVISGSLALLSDALHNLSDVISLVISYIATRLLRRKNTNEQTFGYHRSEIVAAFVNSGLLIFVSVFLVKSGIERLIQPEPIEAMWVIWAAALGIVANGITVYLLHADAQGNINIKAAYLHMMADMLTSVGVFLGGLAIYYFDFLWIDPIVTFLIAIYLSVSSWKIVVKSFKIIMQFTPEGMDPTAIQERVKSVEGVQNLHHIHLWQLNEYDVYLEAHIEFERDCPLSEANACMRKIQQLLKEEFSVAHITLQPEYKPHDSQKLIVQADEHKAP